MQEFWLLVSDKALKYFSVATVFLFFAAAVLLLLLMKKYGFLARANRWHARFVKIYYAYIPVVFLILGSLWAATGSLENAFLAACEESRTAIVDASVERTQDIMGDVALQLPPDKPVSLKDLSLAMTRDYVKRYTEDTMLSEHGPVRTLIAGPLQEAVARGIAAEVEKIFIDKAAEISRLTPETVRGIWEMDIVEAMRGGLVVEILKDQIRATFPPVYSYVKMLGFVLLLPVVLETGISLLAMRLRRRKDAVRQM